MDNNVLIDVLQSITVYVIPLLLAVGLGFLFTKLKSIDGGEEKLKKALEIVEQILPILIAIYKSTPSMQTKADDIAIWFKENMPKYIQLSDDELKSLWQMSVIKIEETFKAYGYDVNLDVNFEFVKNVEISNVAKSKLLFK